MSNEKHEEDEVEYAQHGPGGFDELGKEESDRRRREKGVEGKEKDSAVA